MLIRRLADLLFAHSLSLRAASILCPNVTGRVLASFRSVCDLVTDAGEVVALVWNEIGNGPLNVVLGAAPAVLPAVGTRFVVRDGRLIAGDLEIALGQAILWEARPDWARLRSRRERIVAAAARPSIAGLDEPRLLQQAGPAVVAAALKFQDAWRSGERAALQAAIGDLCGLGPGLTPAGDDWLAGWLLGRHLAPDQTELAGLSGSIVAAAAGRTTTLARAFLACAAAGEADEAWHELLAALAGESAAQRIGRAVACILGHGATSGATMLAGFLAGVET